MTIKHEGRSDDTLAKKWSQKRVVYTAQNPPPKVKLVCEDPTRTDQSQAEECDVNNILKKFQRTGVLPGVNVKSVFADVSESIDYHTAMNTLRQAEEQFMSLNAQTRKRFNNDPAEFMEFVHGPENAEELVKLGLVTRTPESDTDRLIGAINASKTPSPADPDPAAGQAAPKGKK